MTKPRPEFDTVSNDVQEDVRDLARELWCTREQIKNREEELDETKQVLKALHKKHDTIIGKIANCGKFVSPSVGKPAVAA